MSDLTTIATGILPASGYKAGVVYGIVPTNDNTTGLLTTAFDFTSARNGPAYRTNENGVLEEMGNDVCRVQYPTCPSLLLEPAATNLALWSEDFSNGAWVKASYTVTANSGIAPDGENNAFDCIQSASNAYIRQIRTITADESVLNSFYIKKGLVGNAQWVQIVIREAASNGQIGWFDIANGVKGSTSSFGTGTTLTDYGIIDAGNGFYRVWLSALLNTGITSARCEFVITTADSSNTRDQVNSVLMWGGQLEQGSYPTSYIKTEGTSVTRPQDTLAQATPNSDMYNDTEGVLMIDGLFSQDGYITLLAGTDTTNSITIASVGGDLRGIVQATTTQANLTTTIDASVRHKVELRYKANDFSLWVDGVKEAEDLGGLTPTGLDNIKFNNGAGSSIAFGRFYSMVYLPGAEQPFSPNDIPNLVTWLDASDASTITLTPATNQVVGMNDKSSSPVHLDNYGGVAGSITYGDNQINGLDVLSFDVTGSALYSTGVAPLSGNSGRTVFSVITKGSPNSKYLLSYGCGTVSQGGLFGINTEYSLRFNGGVMSYVNPLLRTELVRVQGDVGVAVGDYELFIDSIAQATTGETNPTLVVNTDSAYYTLGSNLNTGVNSFTGDIAEVLTYSRQLSESEITEVENYLNSKWGL